jgi:hypothetical protein
MGYPTPIEGSSSDAKAIMTIMRVLVEELLCQGAMGWIPLLKCLFVRYAWVPVARSYFARP